jgi:hypothetical protein
MQGLESGTCTTRPMASNFERDEMSLLSTVAKPADRAVICTICGDSGMGKTSLAASFPKPIFIRAEDGLQAIPSASRPDAFPLLTGAKAADAVKLLWDQLIALMQEEHDYHTVVIDSVTALERLFTASILEANPKAGSLNQANGGYGGGYIALAALHQRLRKAAGLLNERKGMHVVFIAHADTEMMKLPDSDDYMRYTLRLNQKHSIAPYVDDVDVVGFLRLETFTKGGEGERKKAVSTGERQLIVHATAANVSKNRFGVTEPLECPEGENPLAAIIPALKGHNAPKVAQENEGKEE